MDKKLILLVEDNADDEELTLLALKQGQIHAEVIIVCDGEEALDYLFCRGEYSKRNPSRQPQFFLLDLKLLKMSGLEVLERLRADRRTQFIPEWVLTSSSEEEDILSSYRLGAYSYVRKPVEFRLFSDAVQRMGEYWTLLNETLTFKTQE
jgi:two-component system response regulator